MNTKVHDPQVIELVRIKQWYIPRDAVSYQTLKSVGVPLLIIHKDFLPTLQLSTRRNNIRAKEVDWKSILETRLDQVGAQWLSQADRKSKITDDKMVFMAKATTKNRKSIASLDASLAKFFARWSFRYHPVFSETLDRCKLVADFKFDPELQPVVPSIVPEPKTEHELVLGFTKIKITFYDKPHKDLTTNLRLASMLAPLVVLEVFTQAGSKWLPVHSSTFKDPQIGNLDQFLNAMAILHGRQQLRE